MTPPRITGVALRPLDLPMLGRFVTARGEKTVSRNLLVAVLLSDGSVGIGEASSSLAWPQETPEAMSLSIRRLTPSLLGREIRSVTRLTALTWEAAGRHPTAAAAVECALLDAWTRSRGLSLWKWFGGKERSVKTALTISARPPDQAARAARRAAASGFLFLKVKVTGKGPDQDRRRIAAVHKAAPRAALWVDANQGLSVKEAVRLARWIRERNLPVPLFEQPVARADREGLRRVEREGGIPVAADESARSVEEAALIIRRKLASVVNIKVAKCGISGARKIQALARANGTRLMIGCMAESAIGLSPSVALACGSGAFDFVDLDSHLLTVPPPCRPGFRPEGPRLSVYPERPGSGVTFPFFS